MSGKQKLSKRLFSQHFLSNRLHFFPEWQEDVSTAFTELKALYEKKKPILGQLNESQTEEEVVQPILKMLGFAYISQVRTRSQGQVQRPDYALFASDGEKMAAFAQQQNETTFYGRALAIAEAKYWERPLSQVSRNDSRDIFHNQNPGFQIVNYLTGTGVDWGILTNGREWRLYYGQASSRAKEFYSVDLVQILESGDLEQFKYFWLFFRRDGFVSNAQGQSFLNSVASGSITYGRTVEGQLKQLVFEQVFPDLAGGFVAYGERLGKTLDANQVMSATLSFLYKILFLLYAEGKNLLPVHGDYLDYSLRSMTREIATRVDSSQVFSQTMTGWYDRLLGLFQIIDKGDPSLQVPRYNGGLFHFDLDPDQETEEEYAENRFLQQYKLADAILAPALDKLTRIEGEVVDYSFLGVRQLGSIYEGLLEYRLVIDHREAGVVHLESDKGERKATGSYYTPDYIVKYIIKKTLTPILSERVKRFQELIAQIHSCRDKMKDKRRGKQSLRGLEKELKQLESVAISTLLDIRICDPAMGSGHFLVEAVDFLTDEIASILTAFEDNPVLAMVEEIRREISQNLQQQGIGIAPEVLTDEDLLHRVVMKRCIYGVDLNKMAVELAKVSLWLHGFTIGAPLSFLDHHLRWGNSLVGVRAKEAEAAMSQEESGQFLLLTGPFVGLLQAAEIMRGISTLSDTTFAEVEQSERLFREFDLCAKPYKQLLNIYVAQYFGIKGAQQFLRVYGTDGINFRGKKLKKADAAVWNAALKLGEAKRLFHWDLEFTEVFIDLENASWKDNPGFDAVVGNPPYVRQEGLKALKPFLKAAYQSYHGVADLYTYFYEQGLNMLKRGGCLSYIVTNKWLRAGYGQPLLQFFTTHSVFSEIVDFGDAPIFPEADTFPCIVVLRKVETKQQKSSVRICVPKEKLPEIDLYKLYTQEGYDVPWSRFNADAWSLEPPEVQALMEKIRQTGIPLKQLDNLKPWYGIKTGFNQGFLIEEELKNKLVREDGKSAQIIKPYLRGQDIKRWSPDWDNRWIILLKSSRDYNWSWSQEDTTESAEAIFAAEFPSIYRHLKPFQDKLCQRRDKGRYWWELRPCSFYSLFEASKIIYQDIQTLPRYCWDDAGLYGNNQTFILPQGDSCLLPWLNSPLIWWYSHRIFSKSLSGSIRPFGFQFETLPIAPPTDEIREQVEPKVSRLIQLTKSNQQNYRDVLEWMSSRFKIKKLGQKLERFADLSQEEFLDEVRRRIPKKGKKSHSLGVQDQKEAKEMYNEYGLQIQRSKHEILQLEHQVADLVNLSYGLTPAELQLMWQTAPPKMPI